MSSPYFFRHLFISLVKKNTRWEESISLSKQDKLYRDAIVTAAISALTEVAEDLLSYFVDIGNKECFAATLYVCFDLLRPDVVEELSWQHGLNDFYMPYKIQASRTMRERVSPLCYSVFHLAGADWIQQLAALEKEVRERSKKEIAKEEQEAEQPIINPGLNRLLITQGNGSVHSLSYALCTLTQPPDTLVKHLQCPMEQV